MTLPIHKMAKPPKQTMTLQAKIKRGIHLCLVLPVFLYLYAPLIDHAHGYTNVSRPHTHIHVTTSAQAHLDEFAIHGIESHEDAVLCLLDIDAVIGVISFIVDDLVVRLFYQPRFISTFIMSTLPVSTVYFSALDPPPRF